MSTYQSAKISKFRLRSLDEIKVKLGQKDLAFSDVHPVGYERKSLLGQYIQDYQKKLGGQLNEMSIDEGNKNTIMIKNALSLKNALNTDELKLLNSIINKNLDQSGRLALKNINLVERNLSKGRLQDKSLNKQQLNDSLNKLSELTRAAHGELMDIEREIVIEKSFESLRALGYKVMSKNLQNRTLIRGIKDDISIAAEVSCECELKIDMAGFDGRQCEETLNQLNNEYKKRGIDITISQQHYHGKKDGYVLAKESAKIMPDSSFNPLKNNTSKSKTDVQRRHLLHNLKQRKKIKR